MDSADGELITEAETAWRMGRAEAAGRALDRAEATTARHTLPWLRIQALRGEIELRAGVPPDALAVLTPPARWALNTHPAVALRMLLTAREAAFHCAPQEAVDEVSALVAALPLLAEPRLDALRCALKHYDTRTAAAKQVPFRRGRIAGRQHMTAVADAAAGILDLDEPDLLMAAGGMAFGIGRSALARQLRHRAATLARARGELGTLSTALDVLVPDHLSRAQYGYAREHSDEGHQLAVGAGRVNTACSHLSYLTALAALRGDEDTARRHGDSVLATALPRRLLRPSGVVQHALGLMELAAGRLDEALTAFETLQGRTPQPGRPELAMTAAPDHIEAAVRAGHADRVRDMAAAYIELADAAETAEAGALAARCRALLGAETEFPRALQLHAEAERPFDHARTQLLYGEFLRRSRQRVRAREHLHAAERTFTYLGLPVWARRAGEELRAAGTTPRTRVTAEPLTPQERQVARAVAEGATNRQVAAKLFLSPRTVDYHLRKVFAKLGISSRAELIRNPPPDPIQHS